MGNSLYKEVLTKKAESFVEYIKNKEIDSYVMHSTLGQYNIKINVFNEHNANIYYSTKANRFKLVINEIKDQLIASIVEELWLEFDTPDVTKVKDQEYFKENFDIFTHIYVDGSYKNGGYGYGFALIKKDDVIYEEYGYVKEEIFRVQNNIGGELLSVIKSLEYCKKNNIKDVIIYFDYWGIFKFATGVWKPKSESTKYYYQKFKEIGLEPVFVKVEAHQNVKWNEYVDNLAKKGSELDPQKVEKQEEIINKNEKIDILAEEFSTLLLLDGIESEVIKGKNSYGSRLKIKWDTQSYTYFDIYDTPKRSINEPYIFNATDEQKQILIDKYHKFLKKL